QPVGGVLECTYRTGYEVKLWPLALTGVRLQPPPFGAELSPPRPCAAALRLTFACQSALPLSGLSLDRLRLYLSGSGQTTGGLYELLFNHVRKVSFRPLDGSSEGGAALDFKPEECLHPVGFGLDEGLLPYPNPSFLGYRLLTEYFAFPQKFLFVDL